MEKLLELNHISVHYGGVKALSDVTIVIAPDQIVALMGPNGAGKSTVLKSIFGLVPLDTGEIYWKGARIVPEPSSMVQSGISFVPQGRRVFSRMTVQENLEVGGFGVSDRRERATRISEIMELFPMLAHKRRAHAGTLSGGQQQMLALARGLVVRPELLLLDEPTLGLSPLMVKEVFSKIKEIKETFHTTIVVVEHNLKSLLAIVDRAYILDKGAVVVEGSVPDLVKEKVLEKVMLGTL